MCDPTDKKKKERKHVTGFLYPRFRIWMPSPIISNPQETSAHKTTSNLALSKTGEKKES